MGQYDLKVFAHIVHIMEYRFGPNKPNFTGTDAEWNKLKEKIAWWNEISDSSTYPEVTVICPHCGAKNTHIVDDSRGRHRTCDLIIDRKGKNIIYDCPGYYISCCYTS